MIRIITKIMDITGIIIIVPVVAGLLLFVIPEQNKKFKDILTLLATVFTAIGTWFIFRAEPGLVRLYTPEIQLAGENLGMILQSCNQYMRFNIDGLAQITVLLTGLFGLLIAVYSIRGVNQNDRCSNFHSYFLITLGISLGTLMADNLLLFIFLWGILALTLYKLIPAYDEKSSAAAKKTIIMIGSSDGIMILGIAILYTLTGSITMSDISLETGSVLSYTAFVALLAGSFTKAGAFPLHSWIPDYAEKAPAASSAYLPASLDKLLGIYFLVRICHYMFIMSETLRLIILSLGVITIIIAVMMALVQHDYKKLLGFHAVSQVGYMVLGIGLGSTLGIAAGLFHMINNAIYKSGLFLVAGNIRSATGESKLDRLGGLSAKMPITYICGLIFALSISGIPPFNGFASKWMIYQGIIDFGSGGTMASRLWILWLAVAVLGSALTLASFIKFISGIFFGSIKESMQNVREAGLTMLIPVAVLALMCTALGVFATGYFVPKLFYPVTGPFEFHGVWQSSTVSGLILLSIILGGLIYMATGVGRMRKAESFTGGEKVSDDRGFPVTGFYGTIRNAPVLSFIYEKAFKGWFDIYLRSKSCILWMNNRLSRSHDGVLHTYVAWVFGGLVIILLILLQ